MDTPAQTTSEEKKRKEPKLFSSDRLFYVYIRALVSSQATTFADMAIGFALFSWCGFSTMVATAVGVACGGILNCILNYIFVFRGTDSDYRATIIKYIVVWLSSVALNTIGTELLYNLMESWTWPDYIGFKPDGYYATARICTAIIIYMFWNFALRRHFVYRKLPIDKYLIRVAEFLGFGLFKKQRNNS